MNKNNTMNCSQSYYDETNLALTMFYQYIHIMLHET